MLSALAVAVFLGGGAARDPRGGDEGEVWTFPTGDGPGEPGVDGFEEAVEEASPPFGGAVPEGAVAGGAVGALDLDLGEPPPGRRAAGAGGPRSAATRVPAVVPASPAVPAAVPAQAVPVSPSPAGTPEAATPAASPEEPPPYRLITHVVQPGETLWDIARSYGIDLDTVIANNDLANVDRIQPGEELAILTRPGVLHTVQRGETLSDLAQAYGVSQEDIAAANGLGNPNRLRVGERLFIPGGQAAAAARQREALVSGRGTLLRNFDWPVRGRLTSGYGPRWGRYHYGIDLAVPTGTPVRAAAAGVVTFSGWEGGYGYLVVIDHGQRVETRYAHNSQLLVRPGQRVRRGEIIARSGNTGNSTGPHVHFEIRYRGQAVNPLRYLK